MHYGIFAKTWLAFFVVALVWLGTLNAYVDPLWLFSHQNSYNRHQWGFDERQQKTNRVLFGDFDYDALLFGSSRSVYINQTAFKRNTVFNYAAGGMRPQEFQGYIDFAKQKRGADFKVIYLGLDFFVTNKKNPGSELPASNYINEAKRPLYRLGSLLSYRTLRNTQRYIRDSGLGGCDCYDRSNIRTRPVISAADRARAAAGDVGMYSNKVYGPDYEYDKDLARTYAAIKRQNPNSRVVAFTTPISTDLFMLLLKMGRLEDYRRWLGEAIDAFDEVYDFMGVNSITQNAANYADGHHFYPPVGNLIADRIEGRPGVPADFGVRLTRAGLDQHVQAVRRQALGSAGQ